MVKKKTPTHKAKASAKKAVKSVAKKGAKTGAKKGPKKGTKKALPAKPAKAKGGAAFAMTAATDAGKQLELSLNDDAVSTYEVNVNGASITFSGGKAKRSISAGDHTLSWSITGTPGVSVTISIDAPPEAAWSVTRKIPASGKWEGIRDFSVNA